MSTFPRKWSPTLVVQEIQRAAAAGADLCYSRMSRVDAALVRAAEREFGHWAVAVQTAGYDYETFRRYRRWTRERVIERIREWHAQGADLSWHMVSTRLDPPLAAAALHAGRFASWSEALAAAGLNPDAITRYRHWTLGGVQEALYHAINDGMPLGRNALRRRSGALLAAVDRLCGGLSAVRAAWQLPHAHPTRTHD